MGRKSTLKQIRKLLPENARKPKVIDAMIECPFCHAWGYPRIHRFPKNEIEKKAILCPSCRRDVTPVIEEKKKADERREAIKQLLDSQGIASIQDVPLETPVPTVEGEVV